MMRLQKYIAQAGIASRRKAEELIQAGRVKVNGKLVTEMGVQIDPEKDSVSVNGTTIREMEKMYIALNKPEGYTCTKRSFENESNIYELIPSQLHALNPVGRLDKDSSGLILMSNDGDWIEQITHPSNEIEKEYIVEINRTLSNADEIKILKGIREGGDFLKAKSLKKLTQYKYSIILTEGKNREIRRMIRALGSGIVTLQRIRIGNWKLGGAKPGEWREIKKV